MQVRSTHGENMVRAWRSGAGDEGGGRGRDQVSAGYIDVTVICRL